MHWNGLLLTDAFNIKHVVTFTTFSVRTLHPQTPSSLPNYTFQKCVLLMPSWGEVVLFDDWWCLQLLGGFFFVVVFLNLLVWFWFGVSMFFAVLLFAFGHFNCLFLVIFARATHNETRSALRQQQQLDFRVTTYHYPLLCACVCVVCARVREINEPSFLLRRSE